MQGEEKYESRSLYESAYLYAMGGRLLAVTGERGRNRFSFDNKDFHASRLAHQYYNDGRIEARTLFHALSDLKKEADQALGPRA